MDHCDSHGVDEDDEGAYRCCTECGHVFPTAAALLADHVALVERLNRELCPDPCSVPAVAETDPERIAVCPHCTHDF